MTGQHLFMIRSAPRTHARTDRNGRNKLTWNHWRRNVVWIEAGFASVRKPHRRASVVLSSPRRAAVWNVSRANDDDDEDHRHPSTHPACIRTHLRVAWSRQVSTQICQQWLVYGASAPGSASQNF